MSRRVSETYRVCVNNSLALRGTFILDKRKIVRHESVSDFQIGRNIDEILRIIDAQQHYEKTGRLTPANWQPESEGMYADEKSLIQFMQKYADIL
jgi:peroxiredoxin (alkyl hydroperoxide reductase subunit C)